MKVLMLKKSLFLLIFVFSIGISLKLAAQTEIPHFAHFVDIETNVYRDFNNRLVMNFTISNVADQNDLQNLQFIFEHYGAFETVQFSPTGNQGVYSVYILSTPGFKVGSLRKLFVTCGIYTIFIDDQPYPSEGFSLRMLNNN